MEFVSIIHTHPPRGESVMFNVFEDIKLDRLLGENVLRVMQCFPCEEDILRRQEMFGYFMEHGTEKLASLCRSLVELKDVFEAYSEACCEEHRVYVFTALLYRICVFYRCSSEFDSDVGYMASFRNSFSELFDEKIYTEAKELYDRIVRKITVEQRLTDILVKRNVGDDYVTKLRKCAGEMGIELENTSFLPRKLSPELIRSIAELYKELWNDMKALEDKYRSYPKKELLDYIDQFEFYIQNTALAKEYISHSIPFSYGVITDEPKVRVSGCYDITLMSKHCYDIIPNDIRFDTSEPLFFLSGANGGGKTTYLRTCAIAIIMALNGCPVPASGAVMCRLESIFTHFPRDERFDTDGRLADEEKRVGLILSRMGKRSLVLLNETYSTTNEQKAAEMTCSLAQRLKDEGQFGVYVTHQKVGGITDIPMLCCVVDVGDSNRRTYKIRRSDSASVSHAVDILKKYSLSRADLEERFGI